MNDATDVHTLHFRSVVQKLRRESTHAHTFGGDFCACADSRADFWKCSVLMKSEMNMVQKSEIFW